MNDFLYALMDKYVERCQEELEEILDRKGLIVVDNSFPSGFLHRRMTREGVYPHLDEVFYAEAKFQTAFYSHLPENVVFPKQMRQEFGDGVSKLIEFIGDPVGAIHHRWGGRPGEPSKAEYKTFLNEGDPERINSQLINLIRALRFGSYVQKAMPAEAYINGSKSSSGESSEEKIPFSDKAKKYDLPNPIKYHGHFRKNSDRACPVHGFQEMQTRQVRRQRRKSKNAGNDKAIFDLCLRISEKEPVSLLNSDWDFVEIHKKHYSVPRDGFGVRNVHDGQEHVKECGPWLIK